MKIFFQFFFFIAITVDSKIIRALEIIRVKKLNLVQFYEPNIFQMMTFSLYTVYNKHEIIKIGKETKEKKKVLSQVLE